MFNLDPGKLLVIGVVAIILLGPDRLPQVARQLGGAWRSFNEFRHRMESEVRNTMPDLPPTSEIARLARSPSALLNHLSNMSSDEADEELPDGSFQPPTMDDAAANGTPAMDLTAEPDVGAGSDVGAVAGTGAATRSNGNHPGDTGAFPSAPAADGTPAEPAATHTSAPSRVERPNTAAPKPSDVVVPADPTLN